mgnify:CR=1 FL=1
MIYPGDTTRGTSPRMRGKPTTPSRCDLSPWNIPAYAGKTQDQYFWWLSCEEHPRVCGENHPWWISPAHRRGTSPRMRGKPAYSADEVKALRNIPAYAGKTNHQNHRQRDEAEHPRVCGENETGFMPPESWKGTSPRMRGKPSAFFMAPT